MDVGPHGGCVKNDSWRVMDRLMQLHACCEFRNHCFVKAFMHLATDSKMSLLHEGKLGEKHFAVVAVADVVSMERHMISIDKMYQKMSSNRSIVCMSDHKWAMTKKYNIFCGKQLMN